MYTKKLLITGCFLAVACLSGCESMSNTAGGALIGGGTGAALGGLAAGGRGAVVGALAGGVVGGAVGNSMDQQEKRANQARLAAAESRVGPPMGIADVIQVTRQNWTEAMIINQIRATGSTFQLSMEDIRLLQANNVSPNVIVEMQSRPPVRYVRRGYDYPPPPPVVPVGVGVIVR
jgi:surface antigen